MNKYLRPPNNANKTNHLSSLCNCLRTSGSNCNFDNFVNENGVLGASTKGNHHSNPHDWNELGGVFYTISIILMFSGVIIVLMFRSIKRSKNHMEIDTLLETMRYREELDNNCRQKKRLKKAKNKVTAWLNKNNEKVWTSSAQITIRRSPTFTRQRRESHICVYSKIGYNGFAINVIKCANLLYGWYEFICPPLSVNVTAHIITISAISEVSMDYTLDLYLRQFWTDKRLAFRKYNSMNLTSLTVGFDMVKHLFVPDTFFPNEKKSFFHTTTSHNSFLRIDQDGNVIRSIRLTVTAFCPMNLRLFPLDTQSCPLEIESYGYSTQDIIYHWHEPNGTVFNTALSIDEDVNLAHFTIGDLTNIERTISLSTGEYSRLTAYFVFKRNIGFFLIQVYLPSSLIVVVSWISFWIQREAIQARITIGVTSVLTIVSTNSNTTSKVSYIRSLDIYLLVSFIFVFASLLEYAIIGYLMKKNKINAPKTSSAKSPTPNIQFYHLDETNHPQLMRANQPGTFVISKRSKKLKARNGTLTKHSDQDIPLLNLSPNHLTLITKTPHKRKSGFKPSDLDIISRVAFPLLVAAVASALDVDKEDGVVVLTEANFDDFIKENPLVLVEFYATFCGHCKSLAPEYAKASKLVKIPLAKVECTVEENLGKRFNIQGYPTIKLFNEKYTEPIDFDGTRDADGIVDWVNMKTDPDYKAPAEETVTLNGDNFDQYTGDKEIILVVFHAKWCGHCKNLMPELEKAAKVLKGDGIEIAKVDATEEKKLADQFNVKGFPTIKIMRNGRRFDYDGPREAQGIIKYMRDQAQPAAQEIKSVGEARKLFSKSDITIIGFFALEDGVQYNAFYEASEKMREQIKGIAFTTDLATMKHYSAQPGDIIIYYPSIFVSKYEKKQKVYNKNLATAEDLLAFWKDNSAPMVGQMTRANAAFAYSKFPLVVVYYNADFTPQYREGSQFWRKKVVEVANEYKDSKYRFAVADEEEFGKELAEVGLGDSGLEQNVIIFGFDGKKYPMDPNVYDGELDENLAQFMKDTNTGKVKAFVKSAPVPKSNNLAVKTVVASTFNKIVGDEKKDALIYLYAPWCGHCQKFEKPYSQLAEKLKKEQPNLVLGKMDATSNDPPLGFGVEGFPTIYFAPAGKKSEPIKYTGNRDLDDLVKFMKKHAVKSYQTKEEL
uniref:Protein disulfide-isomerase n=1 Tax=Rhabditophanes sp. KR3021 TaxID=114890 RepID=A0AC35U9B3_9BILA